MKSIISYVCWICSAIVLASCATTFEEPSSNNPHAILKFKPSDNSVAATFGGLAVSPLEINGLPPSKLKWSHEEFRIPAGDTVVLAEALISVLNSTAVVADGFLKFNAAPGETYFVSQTAEPEFVTITVSNSKKENVFVLRVPKHVRGIQQSTTIFIPTK